MKIVTLKAEKFDKYANTHRYRNYYQSSAFADVMSKYGFTAHYIGILDNDSKLIGASLILYKTVFMNYKIAYAPRGILFNYESPDIIKELGEKLKNLLGKQGFIMLRIDPYIPLTVRDNTGNIINFNNKGNMIVENLKAAGFSHRGKNLFFETEKPRWESLVLLNRDIREIFAKFDKRTRNKIRKAANNGIEIVKDESKDVSKLYEFVKRKEGKPISYFKALCESYGKDIEIYYARLNTEVFIVNSRKIYEKELEENEIIASKVQDMSLDPKERNVYLNKKMESDKLLTNYKENILVSTDLLKNNPKGIIIAGAMVLKYDNAAYIITEGLDDHYSHLNANYLIKWRMIDDYNKQGLKYLNLNAVVGEFEKKNEYSGLNEMKLGFNSTVTEYIGQFDIVLNNFGYKLFEKRNKKKK